MKITHRTLKNTIETKYVYIDGLKFNANDLWDLLDDANDGNVNIHGKEYREALKKAKIFETCGNRHWGSATFGVNAKKVKKYIEDKIWKWDE